MNNNNLPKLNFPPGLTELLVRSFERLPNGKIKIIHDDPMGVFKSVPMSFFPNAPAMQRYLKAILGSTEAPTDHQLKELCGKKIIAKLRQGKNGFMNLTIALRILASNEPSKYSMGINHAIDTKKPNRRKEESNAR